MNKELGDKSITMEEGVEALRNHISFKASQIREKYGNLIDIVILKKILADPECVKFPTRFMFDSAKVDEGMFAAAQRTFALITKE